MWDQEKKKMQFDLLIFFSFYYLYTNCACMLHEIFKSDPIFHCTVPIIKPSKPRESISFSFITSIILGSDMGVGGREVERLCSQNRIQNLNFIGSKF